MSRIGKVYVVCAIDTEGPIQDPRKPDILDSWDRVDALIKDMTSKAYRCQYPDSEGKGLIYSWFILTLSGFKTNPFNRPMGYNIVHRHYLETHGQNFENYGDGIYWHYHQPAPSGIGNEWCRDWTHTNEYLNILAHLVLDEHFFPACFRAGGRIEDNDLSHWLEQWIPFDYSNCSGNVDWERRESDGKKLKEVCDWSRASRDWFPYHPSFEDYQISGNQRRWVFRCPDLASPVHQLSEADITEAFQRAQEGEDAVLAFFEHDRRDHVKDKIHQHACQTITRAAQKFQNVRWVYANAAEAAMKVLRLSKTQAPSFSIRIQSNNRLMITTSGDIFGTQPFTCAVIAGKYDILPLQVIGRGKWLSSAIPLDFLTKVGIAANHLGGQAGVSVFEWSEQTFHRVKKEGVLSL
ncbi:MAG: hypothetical protein COV74_09710 [Candidatus Omnitrophica bacterium CG11_big_fil_rev_8_21_14_0_20_45_26]|uniref:Uncharacterized protein n=1 Tax=Candidatus Abzuiibacterium crystallinum TaxID=1974748 RepID=A0A2H0LP11_9BACT|nr:MAG: hypothetical protein COV74_09710 [Candidatus Omnitrophica bacterium CG11_big_fil_rev_8_21_14_0_20_45_26]PIW64484.1 MAG: hypothetical protein COW12_05835 [Candidatus Omnitrophica bacterium CG12_big_fil_rev_8_21_14_0_65_45_16]